MPNYTVQFRAMGCHIQAWLNVSDAGHAAILQSVPRWFEHWETIFSRFRPQSELSCLNQSAGAWVAVSPSLLQVIQFARRAAELTNGLFNPLVLNALESAGYDRPFDVMPEQSALPASSGKPVPSPNLIEIQTKSRHVRLPPGARLDLGGIAKGWAAEQAAIALGMTGAAMVDAGGDMVARGSPDDSGGWIVQVPVPEAAYLYRISLKNCAIATSGTDYRRWERAGTMQHHIIDPRTGAPAQTEIVQASVIAPDMLHAEVWAKAALISGNQPPYSSLLVHKSGNIQKNGIFEEGIYHVQA